MRWVVLILGIPLLAGCISEPEPAPVAWTPTAFHADYKLVPNNPEWAEQRLIATLAMPVQVMGPDEVVREAYPLHLILGPALDMVFYLDGGFKVGRIDHHCGQQQYTGGGPCGERRSVSFLTQGALSPLGLGWAQPENLVAYRTYGRPAELKVVTDENGTGLPPGAPAAFAPFLEQDDRYQMDAQGVPETMVLLRSVVGGGYTATRTSLELSGPLPSIEPWPTSPTVRPGRMDFGFPGMGDEVFSMGVTWRDAFDAWQDGPTGADLDGKCLDHLDAHGVLFEGAAGLLVGTYLEFAAQLIEGDRLTGWSWRYQHFGPSVVPANDVLGGWSLPTSSLPRTSGWTCVPPLAAGLGSPGRLLEAAWRLPTRDGGWPCAFRFEAGAHDDAQPPDVDSDALLWAYLMDVEDNQPATGGYTGYAVAQSTRSGQWAVLVLPESDLVALDHGGQAPRPLPTEQVPDPLGSPFRCVEPEGTLV